jgi:hypothetical protein
MKPNQMKRILDRVCTKLGICLSPAEQESLAKCGVLCTEVLADEICKREGLDPIMMDRNLYRQILEEIRNETHG